MLLYNLGIRLYGALIWLVSHWHRKAKLWRDGRRQWRQRLRAQLANGGEAPVVWFHCASLGEFEQGRRVMETFMDQHPTWRLVVSFFSPSGYEVRKDYSRAAAVCYLPLDTARNARDFLDIVSPSVAFFVKYELWYNTLRGLQRRKVPTFLVSAIFREGQFFFHHFGSAYRGWLRLFSCLFVQDEASVELLHSHGITHVVRSGDSRFDRVHDAARHVSPLPEVVQFAAGCRLLVAGSTWPKDEVPLAQVVEQLPADWRLVLVPHEIDARRIAQWRESLPVPSLLYSEMGGDYTVAPEAKVLVVDVVGKLMSVYASASVAYVGGGFGVGIHNTLEPAAFGLPVIFGPNYKAFREAVGLIQTGAAVSATSPADVVQCCLSAVNDSALRERMGRAAQAYVEQNLGATDIILSHVEELMNRGNHAL